MKPIGRFGRGSIPPGRFRPPTSREWIAAAVRQRFPKLALALGDRAFELMLAAYFEHEPEARESVRESGARLSAFLASSPEYPLWYSELAALDRAHVAVMHLPATAALMRRDLTVDSELSLIKAHALVDLTTATDELWASLGDGRFGATWNRVPRDLDWPRTVIVWRGEGIEVRERTVQPDEGAALRAAERGTTLSELYSFFGGPSPHGRALDAVLDWIDLGILAKEPATAALPRSTARRSVRSASASAARASSPRLPTATPPRTS